MSQTFAAYGAQAFSKPEYIYIIAEKTTKVGTGGYTGYYKVGQTDNLQERIARLQTGNPHQLECVGWIKVNPSQKNAAEEAAHAAVRAQYRSDENGGKEWFRVPQQNQVPFMQQRLPQQSQAIFMQQVLRGVRAANVTVLGTNIR